MFAYDYYAGSPFGRQGYDGNNSPMKLYYDASVGVNAGSSCNCIIYGYELDPSRKAVVHEFTHSVESTISDMVYKGESGALKEAYSDIMAILAERNGASEMSTAERDDAWEMNAYHNNALEFSRNLQNPGSSKPNPTPSTYRDYDDAGDVHDNCTIIGHAAYRMSTKGFTDEEMERIWYHSLFYLSPNADFETCRAAVIASARDLKCRDDQIEAIEDAFDEVGIHGHAAHPLSSKGGIYCFATGGETPYPSFHVTLTGFGDVEGTRYDIDSSDVVGPGDVILKAAMLETAKDQNGKQVSRIPSGYYRVDITDSVDENNLLSSFAVAIGDEGLDRLDVHFNCSPVGSDRQYAPDGLTRDVVLVLDTSGSMIGQPIADTEKAALGFAEVVFGADASVSLVTFNTDPTVIAQGTENRQQLTEAIGDISNPMGGTNIESGLSQADKILAQSKADRKIIVLMSDGLPTDGLYGDELVKYADEIKGRGVSIYAIGAFSAVSEADLTDAVKLLDGIASNGMHYEANSSSELQYLFGDVADEINGTDFTYVEVACPVNVTVAYNGEILSSSDEDRSIQRTSFGTLTYKLKSADSETEGGSSDGSTSAQGQDDNESVDVVKVLKLRAGPNYNITIDGYDAGKMDYTIGFVDDKGNYSDMRTFKDIKVVDGTRVETGAGFADQVTMTIDADGDGKVDEQYTAGVNEEARLVTEAKSAPVKSEASRPPMYIVGGAFGALAVIAVITWAVLFRMSLRARRR